MPFGVVEALLLLPMELSSQPVPLLLFAHGNGGLADYWVDEFGPPRASGWAVCCSNTLATDGPQGVRRKALSGRLPAPPTSGPGAIRASTAATSWPTGDHWAARLRRAWPRIATCPD